MRTIHKKLFLLPFLLLFLSIFILHAQKKSNIFTTINAEYKYGKLAQEAINKYNWISFDIVVRMEYNGQQLPDLIYNISYYNEKKTSKVFFSDQFGRCYMTDNTSIYFVDNQNYEFTIFNKNKNSDWYELTRSNYEDKIRYMPYYEKQTLNPLVGSRHIIQHYSKDTVINGNPYVKFYGHSMKYKQLNPKTNEFDIPSQYYCITWINKETNIVDSVKIWQLYDKEHSSETINYIIKNISHDNKTDEYSITFDTNNQKYKHYSYHDDSNPPYSMINSYNTELSESLLSYPLVSLSGDTTTINYYEGWILINFWTFGCTPCYEHMKKMSQEKDSLGFTVLQQNKITTLCINPYSNNFEALQKIANKYNLNDCIYSAKGINTLINIPYFPSYYLISPNKKNILKYTWLDDYSNLLLYIKEK